MRLRAIALILLIASLGLSAAACGGDDDGNGAGGEPATTAAETETDAETETEGETETDDGGGGATIQLAADPGGTLAFDQDSLEAAAGSITIELTNESTTPHNVSVEGQTSETITEGTTTLDLELEAGEYDFICAVAGHAAAGMTGTLTVE
jgi:nitrite reductase (NO-forming)